MLRGPVTASSGEIISGNGTVIDLSSATSAIIVSGTVYISGCTVTRSSTVAISDGGLFVVSAGNTLSAFDCVLSGASANYGGGLWLTGSANLTSCTGRELRGAAGGGYYLRGGKLTISGCDLLGTMMCRSASDIKFTGSNRFGGRIIQWVGSTADTTATVTIAPGAIVDLTGNTNTAPVAPGGGIRFESGGATVLYSSGTVNGSYLIDNLKLPATAKLTNTNVVNLGGNHIFAPDPNSNTVHHISGCTITGGTAATDANRGGVIYLHGVGTTTGGRLYMEKTVCSGNSGTVGAVLCVLSGATAFISSSIMSGNTGGLGDIYVGQGGVVIENSVFSTCMLANGGTSANANSATATLVGSNRIIGALKVRDASNRGNIYISAGAIIDLSGNAIASPIIIPGSGSITVSTGGCKVITSAGTTVSIAAGTYKAINKDGTTTT